MIRILLYSLCALGQAQDFHLRDGDRVVFHGDSITDQRLYTTFVETFAVTRFPQRNVDFVHSGWGGDRVTGGGGGGILQRLTRDVSAYNPTVVTIMLGMNDGRYRTFDDQIFQIYSSGYRQIVNTLRKQHPGIRITAIQPSPYDDVTRRPTFAGGYNATLLRYADFIKELAAANQLTVADLNRPVTAMLARANAADAKLAERIIPDRVHPGASGHLIMAAALLRAWSAPAVVSDVSIDAAARRVAKSENTNAGQLSFGNGVSWTQKDASLPMPVDWADAPTALAVRSSDFQDTLNRQILRITGLSAGQHRLMIDGDEVGVFTAARLASGVNLSSMVTPMWAQAMQVHSLTLKHNNLHFARWRSLQVPLANDEPAGMQAAIDALDSVERELIAKQRRLAQPVEHRFEVVPGGSRFQPLFDGKTLEGWHISEVNHHGKTQAWKVENSAITGTQDRPGHGGILLTNRKYRNFEVQLEINPDYGCDSGLFLRATEKGEAYQVLLDYLDGGIIGGVYGEKLQGVKPFAANWQERFKRGEWNHMRARIEGDVPRIQVWLNGVRITDWRDTENHLPDQAADGMIAVQVHGGNRWIPGSKHRFRNLSVRELP